jgi:uncharacterized protein YecA (UPF0149 family)
MDVATPEGFPVTLAIGPETVLPSQWLPWVWDMHEGEAQYASIPKGHKSSLLT